MDKNTNELLVELDSTVSIGEMSLAQVKLEPTSKQV